MDPLTSRLVGQRLPFCLLPLIFGVGAALVLLLAANGPIRLARAAPDALNFPGCAPTLQECLDAAPVGQTIVVQPGTYITSLTLSRSVSLTGVNSATTILQALPAQRVLTVTGAAVDASVVISGLTFTGGNATGVGGGLLVTDSAEPRLESVTVANNTATQDGGGLFSLGRLVMTNVQIVNNTATSYGGGLHATVAIIENGLILGNRSNWIGGGLSAGQLILTRTTVANNTAQFSGAGAAVGAATLVESNFQENQAGSVGGGLHASTLVMTNTSFIGNTSNSHGGGAYVSDWANMEAGSFEQNSCLNMDCYGGGFYVYVSLRLSGTRILNNTARFGGGGGYVSGGIVDLVGGVFQGNSCARSGCLGGGLQINAGLQSLTGTQFVGNTAQGSGGGLAPGAGQGRLVNVLFAQNAASNTGAALYFDRPGNYEIVHNTVAGANPQAVAAIVVLTGSVGITNSIITHHGVGISVTEGAVWESHNLFFGNGADLAGAVTAAGGSQNGDPAFRNPGGWDYHLGTGSVAIDMGTNASVSVDVDGNTRPQGTGFDVGFDEVVRVFLPLLVR